MLIAVHAAIGAMIGNAVQGPASAFSIGFISHFILDMVPHGDDHLYTDYKKGLCVRKAMLYTSLDLAITTFLVSVIFAFSDFPSRATVAAGVVGSVLPDLLVGLCEAVKPKGKTWLGRKLSGFSNFHMWNHHFLIAKFRKGEQDIPLRYGFMMQAVVLTVLVRIIV